jgi:uncharacterized protein (DUF1697 family)
METYISILRGINVGGKNKVLMDDLKKLYAGLNFKNIRTYIQSGNVIFDFEKTNPDQLSRQIENKISEKYKFHVPVIIRTVFELHETLNKNPFLKENNIDFEKLHITFLSDEPEKLKTEDIKNYNYAPDKFISLNKEVYIYCPNGYGNTKLNNTFFERKLSVSATTRNLKTVTELIRIAELDNQ